MQLNASRITVLQAQDDLVTSMREAAGKELLRISSDQAAYKKLLKELIIQVCMSFFIPFTCSFISFDLSCLRPDSALDPAMINQVSEVQKYQRNDLVKYGKTDCFWIDDAVVKWYSTVNYGPRCYWIKLVILKSPLFLNFIYISELAPAEGASSTS